MQLLAKFKNILYMEFRATLKFRKFKVALNPKYRIFLNFAKHCVLPCSIFCLRFSQKQSANQPKKIQGNGLLLN